METIDPATGRSLGSDAIQRVLFVAGTVHVYNIPPMTPGKGHVAASWTAGGDRNHIFTARLRVIETSLAVPGEGGGGEEEQVKTDVVLEDAGTGQLFAAAPYTAQAVVEPVSDSSRFFALRVQDEAGRKASLGVGFEERSEAFDFSVALQEAQKSLAWGGGGGAGGPPGNSSSSKNKPAAVQRANSAEKRDLSLKEGETITVNLPPRFGRRKTDATQPQQQQQQPSPNAELAAFSIPPPPPSAGHRNSLILSSPPSTLSNKRGSKQPSAAELGFDDGKFGEFA
ncbi:hypothetical protein SLS62_004287 [Diatrype stigma]|uniref:NECAP PHear domain-containing protein n=1 Tax=Diatrype stigma TaxID=117547 RepID=A0AAN9YTR3_9PEZI